jgi:PilZ domain-containing protein
MGHEDRRRETRVAAPGVRARVQPGYRLLVVDVSAAGALVEGAIQLRPGSRIEVHLESDHRRQLIAARVTRCTVATIDSKKGITYRAGLAFSDRCDWVRDALSRKA